MPDALSGGSLALLRAAEEHRARLRRLAGADVDRAAPREHDVLLLARIVGALEPASVIVEVSHPPLLYVGVDGIAEGVSRVLVSAEPQETAERLLHECGEPLRSVVELVPDVGRALRTAAASAEGASAVVIIGRSERPDLETRLREILEALPDTLVVVDGCSGADGVFAQAAVARFLRAAPRPCRFLPLGDLTAAAAGSAFGIVHAESVAPRVDESLDLLTLVRREDERIRAAARHVERLERDLARAQERAASAERQLAWHRRTLSWRLTSPFRLPKRLARRALRRDEDGR